MPSKRYLARLAVPSLVQLMLFIVWFSLDPPVLVDNERAVQWNNKSVTVGDLQKCLFSRENQVGLDCCRVCEGLFTLYWVSTGRFDH